MVSKAEIVVEKFDEGVTARWSDVDQKVDPVKTLASKGNEASCIGKEIWDDILNIMEGKMTDKVLVKVEYQILND